MDPTMRPPGSLGVPAPPPLPSYALGPSARTMLSVGDVLSRTFAIYRENFLGFLIISTVVSIPAILAAMKADAGPFASVIPGLISGFFRPLAAGAITFGVYEHLQGRSTTVIECLRTGFTNLWRVLGVALLSGLVYLAGVIACVAPGVIALVVFAVSVPVAVQERTGVMDALRRSSQLTEGFRWTVFAVIFLLWVASFVLVVPISVIFTFAGRPDRALVASHVLNVFFVGLGATAPAVMYYRLRSIKESIDVRDIASVFD